MRFSLPSSALLLVSLFVSGCSRNVIYYVDKGNKLYLSGDYLAADLNYRKAIQRDPKSAEAYYKQGLNQIKLGSIQVALFSLNHALQLAPSREDIKISVGNLCLASFIADSRRPKVLYDRILSISNELLGKDPNSYAALRIKAYLALLESRADEAAAYFRRVSQQRPDEPDVVIGLTESLFLSGHAAEAEQVAMRYIDGHKTYAATYDALYSYYLNNNRVRDAENILKLKISNNPDVPSYATQLAQVYWRNGRQSDALDLLTKTLAHAKRPAEAHLAAGDFYGSVERWGDATQQFEGGMRAAPGQRLLFQKRIANVWLAQGKHHQAEQLVEEILKEQPQDEEGLRIHATLKLEDGQPAALSAAIDDYKALLKKNDRDSKLHMGLARAFRLKGDLASANVEFHEALRIDPNSIPPRLALAEIGLTRHKPEEAARLGDEVLSAEPQNIPARLLKSLALRDMRSYDAARSELERVIQSAPGERSAYLQLGLLEIEQKRYKEAEAAFKKLGDLGGENSNAAAGMAVLYSSRGQLSQAFEVLRRELDHSPNHTLTHQLLASIAVQAHEYDKAIGEYRTLLLINPAEAGIYLQLAEVFRLKGDLNGYISTLDRAQKVSPGDLMPTVLLASALESAGRVDAAVQHYRHALQLQPDDPRVLNNLSYAICESNGNLDEALALAQRAVQKAPDQPNFADTLGWIYVRKNMADNALQVFTSLVKRKAGDPTFRYHLGVALLQKGDREGARIALQVALESKPSKQEANKIRELLARIG